MKPLRSPDGNIFKIFDGRSIDPLQMPYPYSDQDAYTKLQMHSSLIQQLDLERELEGHQGCVNALAWNSKGSLLVSGSDDARVNIWSYASKKLLHSIETGHSANIFCCKFVPETGDELVVSGAGDAEVRVFRLSQSSTAGSSQQTAVFRCHSRRVKKIAVEEGNPNVVWSASEDGTLRQHDFRESVLCPPVGSTNQECRNVLGETLQVKVNNPVYTNTQLPYVFKMGESRVCNILCKSKIIDASEAKNFKEKIDNDYRVQMILDNLPVEDAFRPSYEHGFQVGFKARYNESSEERYFIHNHLSFVVSFHKNLETDFARIVGFEVTPYSVKHEYELPWNDEKTHLITCDPNNKRTVLNTDVPQEVEEGKEIIFTYDVSFLESPMKGTYLLMTDERNKIDTSKDKMKRHYIVQTTNTTK